MEGMVEELGEEVITMMDIVDGARGKEHRRHGVASTMGTALAADVSQCGLKQFGYGLPEDSPYPATAKRAPTEMWQMVHDVCLLASCPCQSTSMPVNAEVPFPAFATVFHIPMESRCTI